MQKKYKGIILYSKIYKENDLFIKFLSHTDEVISGIVYGGLSRKKKGIYQIGFFLDFNIIKINNKPISIQAELSKPLISPIINDKFKLNCLLSVISIINLSIFEGQKINNIFNISENFIYILISKRRWMIDYCIFLFNLLKIIGYQIDYTNNFSNKYFDINTLEFKQNKSNSTLIFPYDLLDQNNYSKINLYSIIDFFKIFEVVYVKNHLNNLNLKLPNHYELFKKSVIQYLKNK